MKRLVLMIKPASSSCDMRCNYCFYNDVAVSRHKANLGIMERKTALTLLTNVFSELKAGDQITFAFQGGEPALAGLEFFSFFTQQAKKMAPPKVRIYYAFQTNGLILAGENAANWCALFKDYGFLIGLSLDGYAALHNLNRHDAIGKGTHSKVLEAKKMLDTYNVEYNILCVLTLESARRAKRIWDFIITHRIKHVQFIPCLEPLHQESEGPALTSQKFYQFYSILFPLWKRAALEGNMVHVRLFEDLAGIFLAGKAVTCGMSGRCSPQMVVEADGSVYPCDFYVLDKYKTSDLTKHNIREVFEATVTGVFLKESRVQPKWCNGCAYVSWCGGGCKRMAKAVYGKDCGIRRFLDEYLKDLLEVYS